MKVMENSISIFEDYKTKLNMKGEQLVLKTFPGKIVELDKLLNSSDWNQKDALAYTADLNIPVPTVNVIDHGMDLKSKKRKADAIEDEPSQGSKVYAFINGVVPCNATLVKLTNVVKPYIKELINDSNVLKMWLSFMIPKIEDGNNFGVSIQEDTLAEITTVESEGSQYYDQITRYYITRGKLVTKVAKYPHVMDYRRSIEELDEKQYLSLCLILKEIQNRYSNLHDIVTKNLEKLKQPRNSNASSLY